MVRHPLFVSGLNVAAARDVRQHDVDHEAHDASALRSRCDHACGCEIRLHAGARAWLRRRRRQALAGLLAQGLRQNTLPRSQFGSRRRFPRAESRRQTVVRLACRQAFVDRIAPAARNIHAYWLARRASQEKLRPAVHKAPVPGRNDPAHAAPARSSSVATGRRKPCCIKAVAARAPPEPSAFSVV
jgi:hypothetical protein